MKLASSAFTLPSLALSLALAGVGCSAGAAAEGASADTANESALSSTDCYANVTPGTDNPGASADSLCIITAEAGAKLRSGSTASSDDVLAGLGWGGLPCGYQFHVDLRDANAAVVGANANQCSIWSYGSAVVNGEKTSGFVNASLFKCRGVDETNDEFVKRFTPACTDYSNGSGEPVADTDGCEPDADWKEKASHLRIALDDGSGADSALVTTTAPAKVAAIFKAYRTNARGETDYVGCFKTRVSGSYAGHVSAAYTLNTTEGFYEYENGVKRYATWADVAYYVVAGDASIR